MTTAKHRSRLTIAILIPVLIFIACALISFSTKFKAHPDKFSLAITLDMILVAPLAYYLLVRKTTISAFTALRVFMLGVLLAGIILSKNNSVLLTAIKTWVSPLLEITLIGFIGWKFYTAKKLLQKTGTGSFDFLQYCRVILRSVFGNEKLANVFASEVAVFYYVFSKRKKNIGQSLSFTSYKETGILLVLYTFLCLFIIETAGMHVVFQLWNKTAAWVLTSLSFYTCIQLFAHLRAMKTRPTIIMNDQLFVRHGLMGGDILISIDNIENIVETNKQVDGTAVVKIALIKGLEKHNLAVYLKEPVPVIKAFGIKKTASILLLSIDKKESFIAAIENYRNRN